MKSIPENSSGFIPNGPVMELLLEVLLEEEEELLLLEEELEESPMVQ
jgi:hypothetical protein